MKKDCIKEYISNLEIKYPNLTLYKYNKKMSKKQVQLALKEAVDAVATNGGAMGLKEHKESLRLFDKILDDLYKKLESLK